MPVSTGSKPIRRATQVVFALDPDALTLLRAMQGNSKGYGLLLSELIRREARERAERPELVARLAAQAAEGD